MKFEDIDKDQYNMDFICCYRTVGNQLQGNNVKFLKGCKHTPWVSDNKYDVYEIPMKSNHSKIRSEGSFFVMAHNTIFNYWVAGYLTVSINAQQTLTSNRFREDVTFTPTGLYEIGADNTGEVVIYKKKIRENIDCGYELPYSFNYTFDSLGSRKKAYGLNEPNIIFKLRNSSENTKYITDTEAVKKYKKKK